MYKSFVGLVLLIFTSAWVLGAPATVNQLIQRSQSGATAVQLKQWLDQTGWPLVGLPEIIQLVRSPVPTVLILELAKRAAQHSDVTRIVKVEGFSIYLAGNSRLVIMERGPIRTWQLTNRLPNGERIGGPAPRVEQPVQTRSSAPVTIHIHYPPRRRERRPPPPRRVEPRVPEIYLFPNPLIWQISCRLQGLNCPVIGPLPSRPQGPHGRVPTLPWHRSGTTRRAQPRGTWR